MNKRVVAGILLVVVVEVCAIFAPDRRAVLWASGAAVAMLLLGVRWFLSSADTGEPDEPKSNDPAELLQRWVSHTETLVSRAESTRTDWDRHLRPRLAREFASATGQRQHKDPAAFDATGRMLFGPQLWQWVDPNNVARKGGNVPGPGREVLNEILRRLELL
ncbi:hypothetical protein [Mycobacterium hubeiense]|uniref:hypothetical protein n=1 Tax=Mycobacterium hubeiense TaxID=1867256 RepID=UPI000C7F62F1|nr:hypothetical protein [Mycobacterium sp. QGD 101]